MCRVVRRSDVPVMSDTLQPPPELTGQVETHPTGVELVPAQRQKKKQRVAALDDSSVGSAELTSPSEVGLGHMPLPAGHLVNDSEAPIPSATGHPDPSSNIIDLCDDAVTATTVARSLPSLPRRRPGVAPHRAADCPAPPANSGVAYPDLHPAEPTAPVIPTPVSHAPLSIARTPSFASDHTDMDDVEAEALAFLKRFVFQRSVSNLA